MSNRVMVFMDYQNLTATARERFPGAVGPRPFTHIDPVRLGELLVSRRPFASHLAAVRVYRGKPSPNREPGAAAANDAQTAYWEFDPRVVVVRRQLRYPKGFPLDPPQEKGIDVALAVDFVRLAMQQAYDVGVIASHDTDLLPALEAVVDLRLAHVETAGWERRNRLQFAGTRMPWFHSLREEDFLAVRDTTDYLRGR